MATAKAYTNIALVKYWGKKDAKLIIPQTDSLSLTLNEFYTTTTVKFNSQLNHDIVKVDERFLDKEDAAKVIHVLNIVRSLSKTNSFAEVTSINNVPTAAGLASSASAFAALAGAASTAAGLHLSRRELSRLARRGSGSATRSIYGGLVEWQKGTDDASSFAKPIDEDVDFPIEMLAVLINTKKKKISSRSGMQLSVSTSPYYKAWQEVVAHDMVAIKRAIKEKDINKIGHIAEENALRMHALTLSADPAFTYFNGETLMIINAVEDLRNHGINCYYTMDAGPNVKIIYDHKDRDKIVTRLTDIIDSDRLVVSQPGPGIKIWNE
ncbi:diphosphomevalonate decarboxylase [Limosilactobacillus sp. STM2_1]|uniref:diphosphomevalonate decarboxylase n=1 Tax=Limosilactobacillus rudii TaxID=2759755 RepID=A0A7W3UJY0_9LACO|nr:diphosphomevalonate decarboxylase [Limosilactobacillus rudii]MBB1079169.1 diphosphomevalonate decarboxylase [Limosilactobacillus rudii]MBB1096956.1 diphosphomevalonate decarboxylase [Limosilactobacillus rudii]MCD7133924.1 diphosphomevalonate decarboxylase [Limosilactobacillus rudii]